MELGKAVLLVPEGQRPNLTKTENVKRYLQSVNGLVRERKAVSGFNARQQSWITSADPDATCYITMEPINGLLAPFVVFAQDEKPAAYLTTALAQLIFEYGYNYWPHIGDSDAGRISLQKIQETLIKLEKIEQTGFKTGLTIKFDLTIQEGQTYSLTAKATGATREQLNQQARVAEYDAYIQQQTQPTDVYTTETALNEHIINSVGPTNTTRNVTINELGLPVNEQGALQLRDAADVVTYLAVIESREANRSLESLPWSSGTLPTALNNRMHEDNRLIRMTNTGVAIIPLRQTPLTLRSQTSLSQTSLPQVRQMHSSSQIWPSFYGTGYPQSIGNRNGLGGYGGDNKHKYNGKTYKVHNGQRGGKYIIVDGQKKYI